MSDFRDYEILEQLEENIRLEIVRARKPGSKRVVLLKALKLDSLSGTQFLAATRTAAQDDLGSDPRLPILDAIKAQGVAGRANNSNIAPIYDLYPTEEGVCFATEYYPNRSLRRGIRLSSPTHLALQNVIGGILRGLLSLKTLANRGHGNLHTNNVLLSGIPGTPLESCDVFLTDIAPLSIQTRSEMENYDLIALGQIIYQWVMRKAEDRRDSIPLPVRSSPEWIALGTKGEFWLRLCNRLLNLEASPGAESIEALLKEIGRPASKWPIRIAAIALTVIVAGVGIWWGVARHGPKTSTTTAAPPVEPSNSVVASNPVVETPPVIPKPPPVQPPHLAVASIDPADGRATIGQTIKWRFKVQNTAGGISVPQLHEELKPDANGYYTLAAVPSPGTAPGPATVGIWDGGKILTNLTFEVTAPPPPILTAQSGYLSTVEAGTSITLGLLIDVGFFPEPPTFTVASLNSDLIPEQNLTSKLIQKTHGKYLLTVTAQTGKATAGRGQISVQVNVLGSQTAAVNLPYVTTRIAPPSLNLTTPMPLVLGPDDRSIPLAFSLHDGKIPPEKLQLSLELNPPNILDQQPVQMKGANRFVTLNRRSGMSGPVTITATVTAGDRHNNTSFTLTVEPVRLPMAMALTGSAIGKLDVNAANEVARIPCAVADAQNLHFEILEISPANSKLLDSGSIQFERVTSSRGNIVLTPHRGYVGTNVITIGASGSGTVATNIRVELTVTGAIHPPRIQLSPGALVVKRNETAKVKVTAEDDYFSPATLRLAAEADTGNFVSVKPEVGQVAITGKAAGTATVVVLVTAPNGVSSTAHLTATVPPEPVAAVPAPVPVPVKPTIAPPVVVQPVVATPPIVANAKSFKNETGMILVWVPDLPETDGPAWLDGRKGGGWVAQDEVTQGQFQKVLGVNPSANKGGGDFPVENITFKQANEFCAKLTAADPQLKGWRYALPSEAQWKFFAGDLPPPNNAGTYTDVANYKASLVGHTIAVGKLSPNRFGLYDVFGNVSELTSSPPQLFSGKPYAHNRGGSYKLTTYALVNDNANPVPAADIGFRVILMPVSGN